VSVPRRRVLTLAIAAAGAGALAVLGGRALAALPAAGHVPHPYGARAVVGSLQHQTANAVMAVTLDQRGLDTLGEEFILLAAAVGTVLLLRRLTAEARADTPHSYGPEDVFEAVRLVGYALLPVVLLVGGYVVVHGHVSPGGGFQGGAVLATGLHLAYLAGDYRTLERLRPPNLFDVIEGAGAFGYVVVGFSALAAGSSFLTNWWPLGHAGNVISGGMLPALNVTIGVEVGAAFVLVVAKFLEQALLVPEDVAEEG
jgi:multicomponent Na+:H+ antiporter subunit B